MKQCIRLMIVLVTMTLPCIGYSGDDRFDAFLPLTAFRLMEMFQTFFEGNFPRCLFNLEEVKVWSFNRDHYSSDGWVGTDEQTVDGILTVTATFHTTLMGFAPSLQLQPLKFLAMKASIQSFFPSILPLLTEYFRTNFNPDKEYYLGRANIDRNQQSLAVVGPDDLDDELSDNHDVSNDEDEAFEKHTGARVISKKCECYGCSYSDCEPIFEAPEYWKAHLVSDMKKGTITYKASLYYSGFLKPALIAGARPEPSPAQNGGDEEQIEKEDLITQTRQCIDLYEGGLDKGLSEHLASGPK